MNDLKLFAGFGGQKQIPDKWDYNSDRIAKACTLIKNYDTKNPNIIDYGFTVLKEVSSDNTQ